MRPPGRHDPRARLWTIHGQLRGNDEEEAEKQAAAREPKLRRGATAGSRGNKNAQPLIKIGDIAPSLRADELIGGEVRSSDDKIIGEVRNIVFGSSDRRDYVIVASGGFFTPGKDSIVVPIQALSVSQERDSFFVPLPQAEVKRLPLMPDQEYAWLSDAAWRAKNDALFVSR